MDTVIDWPLQQLLAVDGLPAWLRASAPYGWLAMKLAILALVAFITSAIVKRAIQRAGRRRYESDEAFEGSFWDLSASLSQLLIFAVFLIPALAIFGADISALAIDYGGAAVGALIILVAGTVIATWTSSAVRTFGQRAGRARHGDATLFSFLASLLKYALIILTIILALQQFGFQSASLIAILGAVGLAIALSLQDLLKGVAAGVMLAIFRPYRIGDWVEVMGVQGEVVDISPFQTTLKDVRNCAVVVPNDRAWAETIINYTKTPRRRLDLYFDISYDDDIDEALSVMRAAIASVPRVISKHDIWAGVHALADSSVMLRVRPWISTLEFLDSKSDCIRAVKYAFDEAGITIPYPHQVEYQVTAADRASRAKPRAPDRVTAPNTNADPSEETS